VKGCPYLDTPFCGLLEGIWDADKLLAARFPSTGLFGKIGALLHLQINCWLPDSFPCPSTGLSGKTGSYYI